MHRNDVVHRDIKLENLFLVRNKVGDEEFFTVKIGDFGTCKKFV
jgi:serine/threonine protein kinase